MCGAGVSRHSFRPAPSSLPSEPLSSLPLPFHAPRVHRILRGGLFALLILTVDELEPAPLCARMRGDRLRLELLLLAELHIVEAAIGAPGAQQALMCAALDDAAALHHQNLVRALHRPQARGNDERGTPAHHYLKRLLNEVLGLHVHTGG